jgi:putative salt-induced outer membrane protein YdiY
VSARGSCFFWGGFRRWFFAGVFFAGGCLWAQSRLEFSNGDKITGEVESVDAVAKTITFYSPTLGMFTVRQEDAKLVNLPEVPTETLVGLPPIKEGESVTKPAPAKTTEPPPPAAQAAATAAAQQAAAPAKAEEPPRLLVQEPPRPSIATSPLAPAALPAAPKAAEKPAAQVAVTPPPAPAAVAKPPEKPVAKKADAPAPKPNPWKGKFEVGFTQYSGRRDLSSLYLRGEGEKKTGNSNHRLYARYLHSEQDNVVNSDRVDGSYRYRYEIGGGKKFVQLQTTYFRDEIAKIDGNYEQNISLGYRLLEGKNKHVLNIGLGLTGQYRELVTEDMKALLTEAFQDYTFKLSGAISIVQNCVFQYAPDAKSQAQYMNTGSWATRDATNFKVKFYAGLQGKLTTSLSLNLRFEYEYDNAIRDSDAREDERIIGSVGYAF